MSSLTCEHELEAVVGVSAGVEQRHAAAARRVERQVRDAAFAARVAVVRVKRRRRRR